MAEAEELPEDWKNNLGAILRSAAAFGVRLVLLVGRQGFKAFCKKSGQGVVPIETLDGKAAWERNAPSVQEAVDALKARHPPGKLQVCGVEILPQAQSLHSSPFHGPTAFMVGNERGGLTREQIDHCDSFVYIPQFGGGVGSLNVACACSVVLYQFSAWASSSTKGLGFQEDERPAMAVPHGSGSFALQGPRPLPPRNDGGGESAFRVKRTRSQAPIRFIPFPSLWLELNSLKRLIYNLLKEPWIMAQAIVVGGGLAGVSAANTVLECGGKVVLVDKSAFCGGNSTKATSGINGAETQTQKAKKVEDSVQLFTSDTLKGGAKKPELVKVLCGNSGPDVDWLVDKFDLDMSLLARLGSNGTKRSISCPSDPNTSAPKAKVKTLLTKGDAVCGVSYEKKGKDFTEEGPVILATGGFGADFTEDSLLAKYRPDLLHLPTTNGDHTTGDGIKMGEAIGAKSIDLEWVQVHPTGLACEKIFSTAPWAKVKSEPFYSAIITPVIHYCMGGLEIDENSAVVGKSGKAIPGLYAAGEVAGGVHGNNRLGGNSLLDCVVFGRVAGRHCAKYMLGDKFKSMDLKELSGGGLAADKAPAAKL
eukprot:g940.t1